MTNMVKRLARAIAEARTPKGRELRGDDLVCAIAYREPEARAVLKELREPTNTMLNAAAKAMSPEKRPIVGHVSVKQKHKIRYQAMIDKAQEE